MEINGTVLFNNCPTSLKPIVAPWRAPAELFVGGAKRSLALLAGNKAGLMI